LIDNRFYVHAFLFQRRELPSAVRRPLDALARKNSTDNVLQNRAGYEPGGACCTAAEPNIVPRSASWKCNSNATCQ
jgi:hypothetical protein